MRLWLALAAFCMGALGCGSDEPADDNLDGTSNPPPSDKPFCASETKRHSLCADFDQGPVDKDWTMLDVRGGGAVSTATDPVLSLPNSVSTNGAANSDSFAYLVKVFDGAAQSVRVAFDMRVEQSGDDKSAATVLDVKAAGNYDVTFNVGNAGEVLGCNSTEFVDISDPKTQPCATGLHRGIWAHFEVTVDFAPGAGKMVVRIGKKADAPPLIEQPLNAIIGDELKVSLGTRPYNGTGDWRIYFDNIVID